MMMMVMISGGNATATATVMLFHSILDGWMDGPMDG
jgi:hypothetical protein